jgi:alkylhydroperoxidase/carboxymuconolactone decarboxylase family protein YurZ
MMKSSERPDVAQSALHPPNRGEQYVDAALSKVSEFASLGQQIATEHAWGSVWTRDGLDRKQRSLITITLLATMGKQNELAGHIRGALTNGLTEKEIQ